MDAMVEFQGGLGAASVSQRISELVSAGDVREVAQSSTKPVGVPELTISEAEKQYGKKWYKKWWVWALFLGGSAGVGLTIYLVRRKR